VQLSNNQFVMSVSTSEVGRAWPEVQRLPDALTRVTALPIASDLNGPTQSSQSEIPTMLQGRLEIPGAKFTIPEQEFWFSRTPAGIKLESRPQRSWPKILIECEPNFPQCTVKNFAIGASDNTVKGELLRTRVVFSMAAAETWFFLRKGSSSNSCRLDAIPRPAGSLLSSRAGA
jgi:hypothetical protein